LSLRDTAASVASVWSSGGVFLHLVTLEEERAVRAGQAAAAHHGAKCFSWTSTRGVEGDDSANCSPAHALSYLEAYEGPALLLMLDLHSWLGEPTLVRQLRDLMATLPGAHKCIAMVAPESSLPKELHDTCVRVPMLPPSSDELLALSQNYYPDVTDKERSALVTAATGLSEERAKRAFRSRAGVPEVIREKARSLGSGVALSAVEGRVSFDAVGGLSALKDWLDRRRDAFSKEAHEFGLPMPKGALLCGVQGCGKSLSAKAVAAHWSLPLLRLDFGVIFGSASQPETALALALETAETLAPAVMWIDEIEKGLAGCDPDGDNASPVAARVLGAFATWMQENTSSVFVMATANEVKNLPPELLRKGRFDEVFFVDLPDPSARAEILGVHLDRRGRDKSNFDVDELVKATENFSGAELEQVVVSGLHSAFSAKRELENDDLRRAAEELVPLYNTYEERVKALRTWARQRARPAALQRAAVDLLRRNAR